MRCRSAAHAPVVGVRKARRKPRVAIGWSLGVELHSRTSVGLAGNGHGDIDTVADAADLARVSIGRRYLNASILDRTECSTPRAFERRCRVIRRHRLIND